GAVVNASVIWESRGQRTMFTPAGVSGLVNVEITPELCVRLAGAWATTLGKGATVTTCRDVSSAARALKRAVHGALNASGINVLDLEAQPMPVARFETARGDCDGGIALRTSPHDPESIDIIFMDSAGLDLSQSAQRKLERVYSRQEYRRAFPGEIAGLTYPPRVIESYTDELLRRIDVTGVCGAGLKVVADFADGTASLVLPRLLGRIGVDVLTVNNRLDESAPAPSLAQTRAGLQRLADLVSSSRADFGVRFDPVGERLTLVDDKGGLVGDDRALLVVLDLIAAERHGGWAALPVTTTRVAEQVGRFHGVRIAWTPTALHSLYEAAAADDVIFAGDGRAGFIVPEFSRSIDGIAAFARLLGLVARTRLTLSQIEDRIPESHLLRRSTPTPWVAKGTVMRTVMEAAGDQQVDTTDGVRVIEPGRGWILVLPDPSEAVTHLWAESDNFDEAAALLDEWAAVVQSAES
ncbi:MAG: mannose-1-phosphate guanyltransferase, partial [Streptosporangiaceae bacterium]